jgi:STAS-like domain of unknown function (DUF4325)
MIIALKKFGEILTSRQAGKEAYAAFTPSLTDVGKDERVVVDFSGVHTFTPSWGDEFLTPLLTTFGKRLMLTHANNPSVVLTIETLEGVHEKKFIVV